MRLVFALACLCLAQALRFKPQPAYNEWLKLYPDKFHSKEREEIFDVNRAWVMTHNEEARAGKHSYSVSLNHFADLTLDEFTGAVLGKRPAETTAPGLILGTLSRSDVELPASVDWRDAGIVTKIKNQGDCGSCWAFSAVTAMEGLYNLANNGSIDAACTSMCGKKTKVRCCDFSVQEIVDCTAGGVVENCTNGGDMQDAFRSIAQERSGAIVLSKDYPYTSGKGKSPGQCHTASKPTVQTKISGYMNVTSGDESALKEAVASHGVVSVGIDAGHAGFQYYDEGVYSEPFCYKTYKGINHGVAVVGYGADDGASYWLIKNSWGTDWGMNGYIEFARDNDNMCAIATDASFPVIKK